MTLKEAFEEGVSNGYGIARENIWDFMRKHYPRGWETAKLRGERRQNFISECLETESDHFRQFSPFEFFAKELNDMDGKQEGLSEVAWERYEYGVLRGIKKAIREHNQ